MKRRYIFVLIAVLALAVCVTNSVSASSSYSKTYYDSNGNYIDEIWTKISGANGYSKIIVYSDYSSSMVSYTIMPSYYAKVVYKSNNGYSSDKTYYGYKISSTKYQKSGSKTKITINVKKKGNKIAKYKKVYIIYNGHTYVKKTNSKGLAIIYLKGSFSTVKKYSFVYW